MRALGTAGHPLTKAEKQQRVKARRDRQEAAMRRACLIIVYAREQMRCQRCKLYLMVPFHDDQPLHWAHGHERIPRSLGGSPYDPNNIDLLCPKCHNLAQAERKR